VRQELTSAIQDATVTSAPKRRRSADQRTRLHDSTEDEIRQKNRLRRQREIRETRFESPGQPLLEVGDLSAERVEERTVERYAEILRQ
jgi:hypothetical protein